MFREVVDIVLGVLFLHPHPTNSCGLVLFMLSYDSGGLERAARLFPIRTGVAASDWLVTSAAADYLSAGGLIGAGCVFVFLEVLQINLMCNEQGVGELVDI